MTALLIGVLAVVVAFSLGRGHAPVGSVIVIDVTPAETESNGSSGCLPIVLISVLLLIALSAVQL